MIRPKTPRALTGRPMDTMCNANGPPTPRLPLSLAKARQRMLPSGVNKPWAGFERCKISGLHPFIAAGPPTVD